MTGLEIFEGERGGECSFSWFFFLQLLDLKMKVVGLHPPPPQKKKLQNTIFFVKIFRSKVGALHPNL